MTRTGKPTKPGCCRCCNRRLKDPASLARGIGPVCVRKAECNGGDEAWRQSASPLAGDPLVVGLVRGRGVPPVAVPAEGAVA